jgi:hypothetical protein
MRGARNIPDRKLKMGGLSDEGIRLVFMFGHLLEEIKVALKESGKLSERGLC